MFFATNTTTMVKLSQLFYAKRHLLALYQFSLEISHKKVNLFNWICLDVLYTSLLCAFSCLFHENNTKLLKFSEFFATVYLAVNQRQLRIKLSFLRNFFLSFKPSISQAISQKCVAKLQKISDRQITPTCQIAIQCNSHFA